MLLKLRKQRRNVKLSYGSKIKILDGAVLEAGDELTEGSINPHDLLKIKGLRAVQDYMIREVQRVYRLQGVEINDKHVEVIVRQMLKKIKVDTAGDSEFLPGTTVEVLDFNEVNEQLEAEGKEPATGTQIMLGITKASLATSSFLSACNIRSITPTCSLLAFLSPFSILQYVAVSISKTAANCLCGIRLRIRSSFIRSENIYLLFMS